MTVHLKSHNHSAAGDGTTLAPAAINATGPIQVTSADQSTARVKVINSTTGKAWDFIAGHHGVSNSGFQIREQGGTVIFDSTDAGIVTLASQLYLGGAVFLPDGSAAAPVFSFSGDTDTGLYRVGADSLGISIGGTLRFSLTTALVSSTLPFAIGTSTSTTGSLRLANAGAGYDAGWVSARNNAGGADVPLIGVMNDDIVRISPFGLTVAVDGNLTGAGFITATTGIKAGDGSDSAPAFSFGADTNTGLYRIGEDNIGIATNGVKRIDLSATQLLIAPSVTPAFVSGDKYLVVSSSGNVHVSAIGPAS